MLVRYVPDNSIEKVFVILSTVTSLLVPAIAIDCPKNILVLLASAYGKIIPEILLTPLYEITLIPKL